MIKENHIALSKFENIVEAVEAAYKKITEENILDFNAKRVKIEVEINNDNKVLLESLLKQALVDVIMLDNFSRDEIKTLVAEINALKLKYPDSNHIMKSKLVVLTLKILKTMKI